MTVEFISSSTGGLVLRGKGISPLVNESSMTSIMSTHLPHPFRVCVPRRVQFQNASNASPTIISMKLLLDPNRSIAGILGRVLNNPISLIMVMKKSVTCLKVMSLNLHDM